MTPPAVVAGFMAGWRLSVPEKAPESARCCRANATFSSHAETTSVAARLRKRGRQAWQKGRAARWCQHTPWFGRALPSPCAPPALVRSGDQAAGW